MRSIVAPLLAALTLAIVPAHAQQSLTRQALFYPLQMRGELVGCQVGFGVIREDVEFSQGAPVLVNGLIVFYGPTSEQPGVMLRLGVASATVAPHFQPPERAFLVRGITTNVRDSGQSFLSDLDGFRGFPFALGQQTVESLGDSLTSGQFQVAYGMPNTSVDARFTVDMSVTPGTTEQWIECVDAVLRAMPN